MLRCSLRFEKGFNLLKSQIQVRRLVNEPNEFAIFFTDRCDNCGICVRYCPYGALEQETKKEDK
jgi:ferredoxin